MVGSHRLRDLHATIQPDLLPGSKTSGGHLARILLRRLNPLPKNRWMARAARRPDSVRRQIHARIPYSYAARIRSHTYEPGSLSRVERGGCDRLGSIIRRGRIFWRARVRTPFQRPPSTHQNRRRPAGSRRRRPRLMAATRCRLDAGLVAPPRPLPSKAPRVSRADRRKIHTAPAPRRASTKSK
jgi:hypothetical protein